MPLIHTTKGIWEVYEYLLIVQVVPSSRPYEQQTNTCFAISCFALFSLKMSLTSSARFMGSDINYNNNDNNDNNDNNNTVHDQQRND